MMEDLELRTQDIHHVIIQIFGIVREDGLR